MINIESIDAEFFGTFLLCSWSILMFGLNFCLVWVFTSDVLCWYTLLFFASTYKDVSSQYFGFFLWKMIPTEFKNQIMKRPNDYSNNFWHHKL